jgi:hypothetical protein
MWEEHEVPSKMKPVVTHQDGDVMMGQRGRLETAAFQWRAALDIVDVCGEVLQLEGDKGLRKWRLMEETGGSRRRSPMNGGQRRGLIRIPCGRHPPVIDGGQEVGRCVGRTRAAREEERKRGKGRGCGGGGDRFNSARRVGDGRWGGATWRAMAERGGERGGQARRGAAQAVS